MRSARGATLSPRTPHPAVTSAWGPARSPRGRGLSRLSSAVSLMKSRGGCFSFLCISESTAKSLGPRPQPPWICGLLLVACTFRMTPTRALGTPKGRRIPKSRGAAEPTRAEGVETHSPGPESGGLSHSPAPHSSRAGADAALGPARVQFWGDPRPGGGWRGTQGR